MIKGKIHVSERLSFYALSCVHDEYRTVTRRQRPGDFIVKVDMAGRIDQIENILFPVVSLVYRPDSLCLDRNSPFSLQIHIIKDLTLHFTLCEKAGHLNDAVGQS